MPVYANAQLYQLVRERLCRRLAAILRDHHAVGAQAARARLVDQAERVRVVCNVQIAAPLGMLDVVGVEHQHQFRLLAQLKKHFELAIRLKPRQYARGVIIVEELAAKFQVQLAAKLRDALPDVLRLQF